jgi:hypothetical protein
MEPSDAGYCVSCMLGLGNRGSRGHVCDAQEARRFLSVLKEGLKGELQQEEILIVERDVGALQRLLIF